MPTIRDLLDQMIDDQELCSRHSYKGFSDEQWQALNQSTTSGSYKGKVRELISHDQSLSIYHTDRLSAFDRYVGLVPLKGVLLSKIAEFWLKKTKDVIPNHYLGSPHDRILEVEKLEPVKVEVIVRGYLAGSMARAYKKGVREFCGEALPDGLIEFRPLPEVIITPTTKAEAFEHDEETTPAELIQQGIVTASEWQRIRGMALELFAMGQSIYREHGWILVDTKYEFGRTPTGDIKIIDEIHTPDSSRLWRLESFERLTQNSEAPEMMDKEIVRRYLMSQGFSGEGLVPAVPSKHLLDLAKVYLEVAESLLGPNLKLKSEDLPFLV